MAEMAEDVREMHQGATTPMLGDLLDPLDLEPEDRRT
jgi:hypothetical protein